MRLIQEKIETLVGNFDQIEKIRPFKPFKKEALDFLSDLSKELLSDKEAKQYPDVISFGFWCRKSNLKKLSTDYIETNNRIGLGLIFHITPNNVPVNFAFSFAFSLLAGNSNIVKVPSKNFVQIDIICNKINKLIKQNDYSSIFANNLFIRYPQDDSITAFFSIKCNARVVWGSDSTVNKIRQIPIPSRSIDIAFSDRYSFSIIDPSTISNLSTSDLKKLSENFYNDTYLMDQNACSSPHLIIWKIDKKSTYEKEKKIFWDNIREFAESNYNLQPINVIDKFTLLCSDAINNNQINTLNFKSNFLYEVSIKNLPHNITSLSGNFGYFYEISVFDLKEISYLIETKIQTITYFGIPKNEILNLIIEENLIGVDRIVPIGSALDIGIYWDGYDLIKTFSRFIFVN
jgi:hypothetical protein